MTWRQTESLSVQLRNLITTARGGPCISNVHLSAILELHPSFLSLFLRFQTQGWKKAMIWRQLRGVIRLSFLYPYIAATLLSVFWANDVHSEQELFSKLRYCSLLRTYGNSASLKCFQSLSSLGGDRHQCSKEVLPQYCWHLTSCVLNEWSASSGWWNKVVKLVPCLDLSKVAMNCCYRNHPL